jgi:cob(I)alamin adenosyltransferase
MTVNLTRIYTRLGDGGETHLGDMSRVPKTHPRIEAYGTVDELNAQIGVALTIDDLPEAYREWLARVQNDLFDVGADIAAPEDCASFPSRRRGWRSAATRSTPPSRR